MLICPGDSEDIPEIKKSCWKPLSIISFLQFWGVLRFFLGYNSPSLGTSESLTQQEYNTQVGATHTLPKGMAECKNGFLCSPQI